MRIPLAFLSLGLFWQPLESMAVKPGAPCGHALQETSDPLLQEVVPPADAQMRATQERDIANARPESQKSEHDLSGVFDPSRPAPITQDLGAQPGSGRNGGFDFSRDPFGSSAPGVSPEEMVKKETAARPAVDASQQQFLQSRYDFTPRSHEGVAMSRGKPVPKGPTARMAENWTWEKLAELAPREIREQNLFPYPSLPHPLHANGGQVFPALQIGIFPRLERFDVGFDLPDAFLPEFPPAIFLQNRPELGDVSRGEVLTLDNFHELLNGLLTPVQLDGMRLLLTPLPQEEFNLTSDRKTIQPSLGVSCLDCHVNGHTTAQFHLSPDIRPQERRFRLDTVSLRGLFNQQIHGSKRSLRSVEDFTEFEQRTAYFNGDPIRAIKKGFQEMPRVAVSHMAQAQNMFDFPPAPKLDLLGRLDRRLATPAELAGEALFHGKAQCSTCHPAPFFLDDKMHDLRLERFLKEPGDGPIKTFTLRGIKDSPPYMHDGRCLTLDDTVEFFNLVMELKLSADEKAQLVSYLLAL